MLTELTHNDLVILIICWSIWTYLWAYICGLSWKSEDEGTIAFTHFIGGFMVYIVLGSFLIWGGLYNLLVDG